jgi:hypothetical protein
MELNTMSEYVKKQELIKRMDALEKRQKDLEKKFNGMSAPIPAEDAKPKKAAASKKKSTEVSED